MEPAASNKLAIPNLILKLNPQQKAEALEWMSPSLSCFVAEGVGVSFLKHCLGVCVCPFPLAQPVVKTPVQ